MRRAAKRDESEKPINAAIEAVGRFRIVKLNDPAVWDEEVFDTSGNCWRAEIKTGDKGLTPRQEKLFAELRAMGVVIHVWRSPLEALAALGCTSAEARSGLLAAAEHAACMAGTPSSLGEVESMLSEARQRLGIGALPVGPLRSEHELAMIREWMKQTPVVRTHDGAPPKKR